MRIELTNYLPNTFNLEVFQTQDEVIKLVNEELSNDLWRPFIERVLAEMKNDPDNEWTMWEGFWHSHILEEQSELIVAALHLDGIIYTRGMRVQHVPIARAKEIQDALIPMIQEYMESLCSELKKKKQMENPFTEYGQGKSRKHLCSICKRFWPDDEFGHGFGNNPQPIIPLFEARCCDKCNKEIVLPARIARMNKGLKPYDQPIDPTRIDPSKIPPEDMPPEGLI